MNNREKTGAVTEKKQRSTGEKKRSTQFQPGQSGNPSGRPKMTAEEKKRGLYLRQKELLDTFLEHGAISRAQYDKSLGDLTVKMGMEPDGNPKV